MLYLNDSYKIKIVARRMLTLGIRFSRHEEPGGVVAAVTEKEPLQIIEKNNGAKVLGETLLKC